MYFEAPSRSGSAQAVAEEGVEGEVDATCLVNTIEVEVVDNRQQRKQERQAPVRHSGVEYMLHILFVSHPPPLTLSTTV